MDPHHVTHTQAAATPVTEVERTAMARALELAGAPGLPLGPNPRVGCVLLHPDGTTIAEGWHTGAGSAHAEADALRRAGEAARGATAVVTLEPCNHTGRTGPCAQALLAAGVSRVVFAQRDPNPEAAGGATTLSAAGVEVVGGVLAEESAPLNRAWTFGVENGRPLVTWKFATTLDGRSAAADGSSRWISSEASRRDVHRLRAEADTVLVGTGTVLADDPALTVRDEHGTPAPHQPLRVVMGERARADLLPAHLRVLDDEAPTLLLPTRDPHAVLAELFARGRRHVLLEGGQALAAAFLAAGLVDEVVAYVAPVLLGDGPSTVGGLGVSTIAEAHRLDVTDVRVIDDPSQTDVRFTLGPRSSAPRAAAAAAPTQEKH